MIILNRTQSICPVCHKPVRAEYVMDKGKVWLEKSCSDHGSFRALVSDRPKQYMDWTDHIVVNIPPKVNITEGEQGECPLHCGTCSNHLQTACCVLIDITERCNQHCPYCFASAEKEGSDIPISEIERKYDLLLELGEERPFNIQLSGGEPTVRDDLPEIIKMGRDKGFEYIQINTNGRRLAEEEGYAGRLKDAGASVIYLQFDGTADDIYVSLRGEPLLDMKLAAIEKCRKAGLPVALVPTIVRDVNFDDIGNMMRFLLENRGVVKGIHFQPAAFFGRYPEGAEEKRVTMFDCINAVEKQTGGMFRAEELLPITSGHTLCCFYGTFMAEKDGVKSMISEGTRKKGISCCEAMDPLDIVRRDRDYVLNKWEVSEEGTWDGEDRSGENDVYDLDEFLMQIGRNMFTVSGMAFMDLVSMDAERLKRCRVVQLTDEDRLIPFCAYNGIYRK